MITPLRLTRKRRGLSQAQVAVSVQTDQSNYSRVENGTVGASKELAAKLAAFFGHEVTEMQILYPERYTTAEVQKAS